MTPVASRFRIVQRRDVRRWPWVMLLALAWLLSLWLVWRGTSAYAAPALSTVSARAQAAGAALAAQQDRLQQLDPREATLARSDQISREAKCDLQGSLAGREEEIASLRTDVAFYERLVGPTQQRKALNVFSSSEFALGSDSAWRYQIVLTQNLNRGAISEGRMRFTVEGVRNGNLASVEWEALHQKPGAHGQPFSFRYFQALDGSVMLPRDFVRVACASCSMATTWRWNRPSTGRAGAPDGRRTAPHLFNASWERMTCSRTNRRWSTASRSTP